MIDRFFEIRSGDTVSAVLLRHGFESFNRDQLIAQSGMPHDFRLLSQTQYVVSMSPKRALTEVRFFAPHHDTSYVFWHDNRPSAGSETQVIPLETRIREVSGRIVGSVFASLMNLIPSNWVASRFLDAYAFDGDAAHDLQRGARFGLKVEEKYWNGHFIQYGEVTKTSLELDGQIQDRQFLQLSDGGVFVDGRLRGLRRPLYSPVTYVRISSPFQPHRFHPIRHRFIAHLGTDFELAEGSPVFAAQDGVVVKRGRDRAAGNFVVIRHLAGFQSSYSHLSRARVYVGQRVLAGQPVGEVGCTGYCTMPHLHFAVKRFGQWINPIFVIKGYPHQYEEKVRLLANATSGNKY